MNNQKNEWAFCHKRVNVLLSISSVRRCTSANDDHIWGWFSYITIWSRLWVIFSKRKLSLHSIIIHRVRSLIISFITWLICTAAVLEHTSMTMLMMAVWMLMMLMGQSVMILNVWLTMCRTSHCCRWYKLWMVVNCWRERRRRGTWRCSGCI